MAFIIPISEKDRHVPNTTIKYMHVKKNHCGERREKIRLTESEGVILPDWEDGLTPQWPPKQETKLALGGTRLCLSQ